MSVVCRTPLTTACMADKQSQIHIERGCWVWGYDYEAEEAVI